MDLELQKKLTEIKDTIIIFKKSLYDVYIEKKDKQNQLDVYCKLIKNKILEEKDENGKKKYSNPEIRDAAFLNYVADDEIYNDLLDDIMGIEDKISNFDLKLEDFKMQFKIYDIITR
jgi:hypothetical protein